MRNKQKNRANYIKDLSFLENPIFIVGHPKSGTTFLSALFDGHSQILGFPEETDFFSVIAPSVKFINRLPISAMNKVKLVYKVIEDSYIGLLKEDTYEDSKIGDRDYSHVDYEGFKVYFTAYVLSNGFVEKNIFKGIIYAYYKSNNEFDSNFQPTTWIEKTPVHYNFVSQINEMFPNAKIIFNYRDPRDNYISYAKSHEGFDFVAYARNYRKVFQSEEEARKKKPNSIIRIKYEDIIKTPEFEMGKICTKLELPFEKTLLAPTKSGKNWGGNSVFHKNMEGVESKSVNRYLGFQNQKLMAQISGLLLSEINILGYVEQDTLDLRFEDNKLTNFQKLKGGFFLNIRRVKSRLRRGRGKFLLLLSLIKK